jgi:hypothetical protein
MERKARISFGLLLCALALTTGAAKAGINVTVTGSWIETVDESDLVGGAGSELDSTYESAADQIIVRVGGAGRKSWRIDVRKIGPSWPSGVRLFMRRTSDGSGPGTISGGTSYQEVTDTYQSFFSGTRNRSNIHVQERMTGVSADIPCGTYTTTIYYTVVQTN